MKLREDEYIHGGTQKDMYEAHEREHCACPLCENDEYLLLDSDRGLSVVKCKHCDLIYTNPRAIDTEKNYFGDASVFFNEARLIFNGSKRHH